MKEPLIEEKKGAVVLAEKLLTIGGIRLTKVTLIRRASFVYNTFDLMYGTQYLQYIKSNVLFAKRQFLL